MSLTSTSGRAFSPQAYTQNAAFTSFRSNTRSYDHLSRESSNFPGRLGSLQPPHRRRRRTTLLPPAHALKSQKTDQKAPKSLKEKSIAVFRSKNTNTPHHNTNKKLPSPTAADDDSDANSSTNINTTTKLIAVVTVVGGLATLIGGGVLLKDQIKSFLDLFITLVDDWGPLGYVAYIFVYAMLELLAVPAIPLTMTAGVIFGIGAGTAVVSLAATLAATGAFLIARYVARDRILAIAEQNPKFAAIDRAIGKDGFRVVALLRLSPLLPLAASNYLYGLTSVDLLSYVAGSWAGMLPGTLAYVAAGMYGRDLLLDVAVDGGSSSSSGGIQSWQVALAVTVSGLAVWYVGRIATSALSELEEDMKQIDGGGTNDGKKKNKNK